MKKDSTKLIFEPSLIRAEQYQDMIGRLYKLLYIKNEDKLAKTITFQVTDDCQLRCKYCYQQNKGKNRMSFETGKKLIDLLFDSQSLNTEYINSDKNPGIVLEFIGGEPLLEIELIDNLVEYFKFKAISLKHIWAKTYMISLISNGVNYFQPKVQEFIKKNLNKLSFSLSIDGNKQLHDSCRVFPNGEGSYEIVIKAFQHFKENYGNIGTKMTLSPENVQHTFDAVINLINIGYKDIFSNCVFEKGWNVQHSKIFYNELKKISDYIIENELYSKIYLSLFETNISMPMSNEDNENWCGGTGNMLACSPNGNLYPCLRYMESSLGTGVPPIVIGDVDNGIAYNETQKCKICELKCITRKSQSTVECFNCPIAKGCAWCSAYNYQIFGTVSKRATFICIMHKARTLANIYHWNRLFRKHNIDNRFEMHIPKEWALEIISNEEYEMLKELAQ
ncbi:radical SAM peptide maturase, CXXX-repeat target family [Desnuesiella massiliensis]|uniref:radical SAM peptide maturase, CXXX-repeat target family n=1 Tax=Desnuesiella massiliensis TaxID=1650662 RepID=UPI0006E25CAD|nr:radical SAM peptide maturase, CXXX-repeat target family [Desnuesiella massiliensis]